MQMREVTIRPVLNGFIVTVGCKTLVFNRIMEVAKQLIRYQKDPAAVEKEFLEQATNETDAGPNFNLGSYTYSVGTDVLNSTNLVGERVTVRNTGGLL